MVPKDESPVFSAVLCSSLRSLWNDFVFQLRFLGSPLGQSKVFVHFPAIPFFQKRMQNRLNIGNR